jgi:hypothetical protein
LDTDIIGELLFATYSAFTLGFAIKDYPTLVPALTMFMLSFAYVGLTGLVQSRQKLTAKRQLSKHAEG